MCHDYFVSIMWPICTIQLSIQKILFQEIEQKLDDRFLKYFNFNIFILNNQNKGLNKRKLEGYY